MIIYVLVDPRTDCIRYVGQSVNPRARLKAHCSEAKREQHRRARWILGLLNIGLRPEVVVIEEVAADQADDAERFWIASLLAAGAKLVNTDAGGGTIPWTNELRERVRRANLGRVPTAQARANMSAAQRARAPFTAEHRERISTSKKGQPGTYGHLGCQHSTETKRKISDALKRKRRAT